MCVLMPKEKVALRESMQNISRSGEKGAVGCACPYLFISLLINRKNHYKAVFLFSHYTLRMRKVINGSMRNVFLSGERGGPSAQQMVESRFHYVRV